MKQNMAGLIVGLGLVACTPYDHARKASGTDATRLLRQEAGLEADMLLMQHIAYPVMWEWAGYVVMVPISEHAVIGVVAKDGEVQWFEQRERDGMWPPTMPPIFSWDAKHKAVLVNDMVFHARRKAPTSLSMTEAVDSMVVPVLGTPVMIHISQKNPLTAYIDEQIPVMPLQTGGEEGILELRHFFALHPVHGNPFDPPEHVPIMDAKDCTWWQTFTTNPVFVSFKNIGRYHLISEPCRIYRAGKMYQWQWQASVVRISQSNRGP